MNKCLVFLFGILLNCGVSIAQNAQLSADGAKGPQFYFMNKDRAHDIGSLPINTSVTYQVQFKNTGDEPLSISNLCLSAREAGAPKFNFVATWPYKPVKPGKKGLITISIVANDAIGSFKNEILVNSNATTPDYPLLYVTGAIVPAAHEYAEHPREPDFPVEFLLPAIISSAKK